MDYLNYYTPERFYDEADSKNLDFIFIDVGSKCSGLAITIVSQRSSYTIPFIDRAEGFEGDNFFSTALLPAGCYCSSSPGPG